MVPKSHLILITFPLFPILKLEMSHFKHFFKAIMPWSACYFPKQSSLLTSSDSLYYELTSPQILPSLIRYESL